ncbi:hypothetical protein [Reinekea sp.]|nr:hypothetical protein [Reinekea sp.]
MTQNTRNALHRVSPSVTVKSHWDAIELSTPAGSAESFNDEVCDALA